MQVVLSTKGSRGDVEPMAALAVALREQGTQVRVCAPPDEDFVELLTRLGVELVPAGDSTRELVNRVRTAEKPPTAAELAPEVLAGQYAAVMEAVRPGCDAIIASGLTPAVAAAQAVAETLGVPYAYATYCPVWLPSPHHPPLFPPPSASADNRVLWSRNAEQLEATFGAPINGLRASLGLAALSNVHELFTERPWLAADPTLAPWPQPSDLEVIQTGAWILADGRALAPDLEAFLAAGDAPVYVGFGSIPMRAPADVARASIEAIRAAGRRALVARGWADLSLIDDGDDCLAIGEVNQQALFGRVAAVVHHGGAGTTTTAARAGAPQVIVPQLGDQPYWAARVDQLGIGVAHDTPTPSVDSLSTALKNALAPRVRSRASALAPTILVDGARRAATRLLNAFAVAG